jgi:hypothetical protein
MLLGKAFGGNPDILPAFRATKFLRPVVPPPAQQARLIWREIAPAELVCVGPISNCVAIGLRVMQRRSEIARRAQLAEARAAKREPSVSVKVSDTEKRPKQDTRAAVAREAKVPAG